MADGLANARPREKNKEKQTKTNARPDEKTGKNERFFTGLVMRRKSQRPRRAQLRFYDDRASRFRSGISSRDARAHGTWRIGTEAVAAYGQNSPH